MKPQKPQTKKRMLTKEEKKVAKTAFEYGFDLGYTFFEDEEIAASIGGIAAAVALFIMDILADEDELEDDQEA